VGAWPGSDLGIEYGTSASPGETPSATPSMNFYECDQLLKQQSELTSNAQTRRQVLVVDRGSEPSASPSGRPSELPVLHLVCP
jgi:hypothetical protein